MSVPYYGDFAEDDTVNIPFNTFTSDDPSASVTVTDLADADIKVYKDGGDTEIATDGATVLINFDTTTGNHLVTIDTSAHADYATGSEYAVRLNGITVDAATLNVWIGAFSIERAGGALALLKLIQVAVITNAAGADVATDVKAVKAETVLIVADTGELQVDDIPGTLTTIAAYLDTEIAAIISLLDDARTEPGDAAPPVNPDAMTKIDYIYKFLRNKIETTATRIHVYDDAGTNKDHSSVISDDDTTFTRGEFGAGD